MTDPLLRYAAALDTAPAVRQTCVGAIPIDVNGIDMLDRALSQANDEIEMMRGQLSSLAFENIRKHRLGVETQKRLDSLVRRNASLVRRLKQAQRERFLAIPEGSTVTVVSPAEAKRGDR